MKGFEKRRNGDISAVFQLESAEIPEYIKNGTANEDLGQRHEALKRLQEPTIFSDKICSLEAQKKILATFWYNKDIIGG